MRRITALEIPSNAIVIDIRDDLERAVKPLLLESVAICLAELEDGNPSLPNAPLVVVCSTGRQSEYAGALLETLGATDVLLLEFGAQSL